MTRRSILFCLILLIPFSSVWAQDSTSSGILLENVNIFNGIDNKLVKGNILIQGNKIAKISSHAISVDGKSIKVIDGQGQYVIPGLIDAHVHLSSETIPRHLRRGADAFLIGIMQVSAAKNRLLRGYTTVRDMGGNTFSLAKAINKGLIEGPRLFPSGPLISQTGGHGDSRPYTAVPHSPGEVTYSQRNNMTAIADGVPEVLRRSREELRQGATQLKLAAGGGVASGYDPIDVAQYTVDEYKAAVSAAENWGTYVSVHVYTPRAIRAAVEGGVKCIEHGMLIDDATAKLLADKGIWWSLQPFTTDDGSAVRWVGTPNMEKYLQVRKGTKNAYRLAKKYNIKVAWGTDLGGPPELAKKENDRLALLTRFGYSPYEILKMATSNNAELLRMSGPRNPYQEGNFGEISEGAYADLILVKGNPLKDINIVTNPENNFLLIVKDGIIYKNTIETL